jgi:hypothetical protein
MPLKMSKRTLGKYYRYFFNFRCDILCLMDKDGWGWLLLIYVLKKFIMEFTLNFNEMECKRFLIKEGYTIERYG